MMIWVCAWCDLAEDDEAPCEVYRGKPWHPACLEEALQAMADDRIDEAAKELLDAF